MFDLKRDQRDWSGFSFLIFSHNNIYLINIVKFGNRLIQNLLNLIMKTSMGFCR